MPEDFTITDWESLEPYLNMPLDRPVNTTGKLEKWLKDMSELEAVVSEDACWRQIRMTCDTENTELEEAFTYFVMQIQPKIQPYADQLNRKLLSGSPYQRTGSVKIFHLPALGGQKH